jgi:cell division protein ZapB
MPDTPIRALEQKIDDLIRLCTELNRENVSLKAEARNLTAERETLVERNELAKDKVEAILSRLKTAEQAK